MTQKTFSREGAKLWIVEFANEGKGWPSIEGFLLREYLKGNLSLDNCIEVRRIFGEMNPYLRSLPRWRLMERYLGKSYAEKPILKNRVTPVIQMAEPDGEDDDDLPFFLEKMLGR